MTQAEANRHTLYEIGPFYGDRGVLLDPSEPAHRVPERYALVPGYLDRTQDVARGREAAWWGTESQAVVSSPGAFPCDFARCLPGPIRAVSDRLREALEGGGVAGLRFSPIRVDGRTPMHVLGVAGRAEVDPRAFAIQLLDGAEVGLYRWAKLCVTTRVMELIREAGVDLDARRIVDGKD